MKIRTRFLVNFSFLMIILLIGCNMQPSLPPTPNLGIPDNEFNSKIKLSVPEGWNTYKIGEDVGINVDIVTADQIAFGYDYGARIFKLEDQKWIEIPNLMEYPTGYEIIEQSKGDPFKQGSVVVFPDLSDIKADVTLRIILIGNIYRDGQITDEQTAGYIDVRLIP